jgi:hypothetical protein
VVLQLASQQQLPSLLVLLLPYHRQQELQLQTPQLADPLPLLLPALLLLLVLPWQALLLLLLA